MFGLSSHPLSQRESLPLSFSSSVFTNVLSSSTFGLEFTADDPPSPSAVQPCTPSLVSTPSWIRGSPIVAVHWERGIGVCAPVTANVFRALLVCAKYVTLVRVCSPSRSLPTGSPSSLHWWRSWSTVPFHRLSATASDGYFSVARPNPILHFAPFLSTHFFPCLNPIFKNGSFLSVVRVFKVFRRFGCGV